MFEQNYDDGFLMIILEVNVFILKFLVGKACNFFDI